MTDQMSGPFLTLAVICERVLREADGVLSLIRIVDRFFVRGKDKNMPMSTITGTIVIGMKSGFQHGKMFLKIRPNTPSQNVLPVQEFPVLFEGQDRGVGVIAPFQLNVDEEGLYWFDVILEDVTVTRIPMRVVYQPVAQTQSEPRQEQE